MSSFVRIVNSGKRAQRVVPTVTYLFLIKQNTKEILIITNAPQRSGLNAILKKRAQTNVYKTDNRTQA